MPEEPIVCRAHESCRSACEGLPEFLDGYCILHSPSQEKKEAFRDFVNRRIREKNFNFTGGYFPEDRDFSGVAFDTAYFSGVEFKGDVSFAGATFSKESIADFGFNKELPKGTKFSGIADFSGVDFKGGVSFARAIFNRSANVIFNEELQKGTTFSGIADFSGVDFEGNVSFAGATFSDAADFSGVEFKGDGLFAGATFSKAANFDLYKHKIDSNNRKTVFSGKADFSGVEFKGYVSFANASFGENFKADFGFNKDLQKGTIFTERADFIGATFNGEANFETTTFGNKTYFSGSEFKNANFCNADFNKDVFFMKSLHLGPGNEKKVTFKDKADFSGAIFSGKALFNDAEFTGDLTFDNARCEKLVDFSNVTFKGQSSFRTFKANDTVLFQFCKFEGVPDLTLDAATFDKPERVSFHSVPLRIRWFVNVDPRKFEFTNIDWKDHLDYKSELKLLEEEIAKPIAEENSQDQQQPLAYSDAANTSQQRTLSNQVKSQTMTTADSMSIRNEPEKNPKHLLAVAYRYLAINAEEAHRYDEASDFRYAAMELKRPHPGQYTGTARFSEALLWVVHAVYFLLCGYGERVGRTIAVLFGNLVIFGVLYTQVEFKPPNPSTQASSVAVSASPSVSATLAPSPSTSASPSPPPSGSPTASPSPNASPMLLRDAIVYSLETGLLQKPEPRPQSFWARLLVGLELIAVPLQTALLALTIRRRFMK